MSLTSRSQSSSPDILGPPGDADYLISSPVKPFTGRQSWFSPAIPRRQQTPAKRPRASLSPAKSAHSIRFDDVLLPGSPAMKLDGRQRSFSPEKVQTDGDVSPWRIRVTLEATQDENQDSPSSKRLRPTTLTTKVPLKDERSPLVEKTPARRRPRKSDTQTQNGSPWPGSPGNTPGPRGATPQKGNRGRPRRGTPKPTTQDLLITEDNPTPALGAESEYHFSPMDTTADVAPDQNRQWSPANFTADGGSESDSLGADDLPVADLRMPTPANQQNWDDNTGHEYGRGNYDTPVIGETEHHFQDNDENIHSTPSKMPSPSRERTASSTRSSRLAGHVSSPRTYPTPTPTSSLEEENQAVDPHDDEHETANAPLQSDGAERDHPTDDHEEFDSIMESEGFTMISLDTLPSAKQHGLGSSARTATDNPSKILRDRENGRIGERLKRKLPGTIDDFQNEPRNSAGPSPVVEGRSPKSRNLTRTSGPPSAIPYPELPATQSPVKIAGHPKRKSLTSLSKLVRVGMALQGPFRPPENEWANDSNINRKERLEDIFSTFSPDTRRELRVAMGLGQELAARQAQADVEAEAAAGAANETPMDGYDDDDQIEEDEVDMVIPSPQKDQLSPQKDPPSAIRAAREDEWQVERETVSRHAQNPANARNLIHITSDEVSQDEVDQNDYQVDRSPSVESVHKEVPAGEGFLDEQPLGNNYMDNEPMEEPIEERPMEEHIEEAAAEEGPLYENHHERFVEEEAIDEEPIEKEAIHEEFHDRFSQKEPLADEAEFTWKPLPTAKQRMEMEQQSVGSDDGGSDIWQGHQYTESVAGPEPSPLPKRSRTTDMEPEVLDDEDDGFDIWQEEARDHSYLSQQSDDNAQAYAPEPASPWRHIAEEASTQNHLSSSPAYVNLDQNDTQHLGQNRIRQLRDKEIDLSALLAEEDTPNRARYYNGTSTPRSILSRRNGVPQSSINGSAVKSASSQKRVRLQPISQSPEREPEPDYDDHAATHQDDQDQDPEQLQEPEIIEEAIEENGSVSDASLHETESIHENLAATPEAPRQPDSEAPASSWLQRITSLTPRWLKAPNNADDSSSVISEEDPEEDDQSEHEEFATIKSAKEISENLEPQSPSNRSSESPWRYVDEPVRPTQVEETDHVPSAEEDIEESIERNDPGDQADGAANLIDADQDQPTGPRPLAVFGYFSDAHYKALRRVYRMAKRHPERFPYYDTPARSGIIGDWIWTSNGHHGVPITEAQFAIIDRFVHDLSRADAEFGGSGQVEWTEADLHRRLISIIIGEQIREERQAKATRGASVDTWR